jgi:hypothetical protein
MQFAPATAHRNTACACGINQLRLAVHVGVEPDANWTSRAGASVPAFSHAFRQVTGKTTTEYAETK